MKNIKLLFPLGAVALLAACGDSEPPREPGEIVAERAQARWDALVAGDREGSYSLRTPGFREKTSLTDYAVRLSRRQATYLGATVRDVHCEGRRCEVLVRVHYRVDGAPGVLSGMENESSVSEIWLNIAGDWWYTQ